MQAVKQPEHERVLTTKDWQGLSVRILRTEELWSKFNFVRFNCSI